VEIGELLAYGRAFVVSSAQETYPIDIIEISGGWEIVSESVKLLPRHRTRSVFYARMPLSNAVRKIREQLRDVCPLYQIKCMIISVSNDGRCKGQEVIVFIIF
jgi:hypothetical protein